MSTNLAIDHIRTRLMLQVGPRLTFVHGVLELPEARRSSIQEVGVRGRGGIGGVAQKSGPIVRS